MYATTVQDIENPFLHDAALVCEKKGFKLRSLYMDPSGECAVSYWGDISLMDSATILLNYLPYDAPYEECYKLAKECNYRRWYKGDDKEHPNGFTQFFTPDGIDYRNLRL